MTERRVVRLLARYRVASLDEFVERHAADLAPSGMFVRTESPLEVGAFVELECRGDDDEPLFSALSRVVRVRELTEARDGFPAGMALQFLRVDKAAERALELGDRSPRFGLRVEAEDRSWSAQQRVSQGLSTPPPPPASHATRIEVRVDPSLAPPPGEVDRTPPLFAALTGGDHVALRPGRVPAGFEGLVRHGSAPDSSEIAAVTPRSAIARPFLSMSDVAETPRHATFGEGAEPPVSPLASTIRGGSQAPTPVSLGAVATAPSSQALPPRSAVHSTPPEAVGVRESDAAASFDPLARALVDATLRGESSDPAPAPMPIAPTKPRGTSAGLWVALAVALAGGLWLAHWMATDPSPAPDAAADARR